MLLTADDLHRRGHYRNADRTLERLLALGVVPIVNENDTVATDEIRFGDNDRLAALVAHLVGADALVLLSDVDGLYDGDPRRPGARLHRRGARRWPTWPASDHRRRQRTSAPAGWPPSSTPRAIATGAGIPVLLGRRPSRSATRWPAAASAPLFAAAGAAHGVPAVLAAARDHPARPAGARRRRGRRRRPAADVAAAGRRHRGQGDFDAGDPVELVGPDGRGVARGLVGYDAASCRRCSAGPDRELPPEHRREVVHRDDLVLLRG